MKRKWLAVGIILLFVGTCFIPAIAQDAEKPLPSKRGNWLYVGGSGPGNYTRIQDAIDNASDGDTVFVYDDSSPYYEHVVIDKSINLIGEDKDTTIIDGNNFGDVVIISAHGVYIQGFTVRKSGNDPNPWVSYSGIKVINCNDCYITFCSIQMNKNGIVFGNSTESVISHCSIVNNIYGISLRSYGYFSGENYGNQILFNIIQYNTEGINFGHSDSACHMDNRIIGNNLSHNHAGIGMVTSASNEIAYNHFYNNDGYAVELWMCDCGGDGNTVNHNNFILNNNGGVQGLNYGGGMNSWDGNYWSDYNGTDDDGNGIGDTPYIIDGDPYYPNNMDHYPLMNRADSDNQVPHTPTVTGTIDGKTGKPYKYNFISSDPDGDYLFYYINWGDDTRSRLIGPNSQIAVWHKWLHPDNYVVVARVIDGWGSWSNWGYLVVIISKKTPEPPEINGPISGKIRVNYTYSFTSTDSEGDALCYYIDWGDGTNSGWIGPSPSGQSASVTHSYQRKGSYQIKAKAKDIYDNEGDWAKFTVSMPFLTQSDQHLIRFFGWFFHAFPILRFFLDLN